MKVQFLTRFAMFLATSMAFSTSVLAQTYLTEPGYDGSGMPYRDCSETYEEEEIVDELSNSPVDIREATTNSNSDLEPHERLALAEQERSLQEQEIVQLEELLSNMPSDYSRRPEILFRLAQAYQYLADADYLVGREHFNECINNWYTCISDEFCYEPLPDYTEAIERYRDVVRNHPSYNRTDEVIFRLGETLMENNRAAEGVTFLSNLVNNYPHSIYICDALIKMGDHYFDSDLLITARQYYDQSIEADSCDSNMFNYSLYKLAWVDINEDLFEDSLRRLQQVVTLIDGSADQRIDFRNQALNDMLHAYVELDNGWQEARDYYSGHEGPEIMRRKLGMLEGMFDEQGKDENRIALLEWFMREYEDDHMVPQWAQGTIAALTNIGDWDRKEAAGRQFIDLLDHRPGAASGWWRANTEDQGAMSNAQRLTENLLLEFISRNHTEAERLNNYPELQHDLYREVVNDLRDFLVRFEESDEVYEQAFFLAELLYYQMANTGGCNEDHWMAANECDEFLREAGLQYQRVVELQPDPQAEHTHDSAVGALQVFDDFMKREVPDIDGELPPPDQFCSVYNCDEVVELTTPMQDYVDIVAWFAQIFPEDDLIPAASWRAAALFLRNGHIAEAAERFETIIEHHPRHQYAQDAALAAFVCYNYVEDWIHIESVARMLLDVCADDENDICEVGRLQRAIAYAMNNQSDDLMTAGRQLEIDGDDDGARAFFLEAAEKRVALYEEFPESEWSPTALFNAAATFERAREVRRAISLYNEYLTRYDATWFAEHSEVEGLQNLSADAIFTLGLIHDSLAEFTEAIAFFESLDAFEDFENRTAAIYNAGRLREAMSQYHEAIALYEHFIELDPESDEAKQVFFIIATIEEENLDNPDASFDRLTAFMNAYPDDQVRRLVATSLQADIRWRQDRQEDALEIYETVYNLYGPGELGFGENGLPTGWIVEAGGNFVGDERISVLPFAAEARFRMADIDFMAARNASLAFEAGDWEELRDNLVSRGDLLAHAQQMLFEAERIGDAEWAVAASARIGELYHEFYRDIYQLPPPDYDECLDDGGSYDDCDQLMEQYDEALYTLAAPLEAKATAAYENGRNTSLVNNVFTEWTLLINTELNDISRTFRVGGAEGLVPSLSNETFISTTYILDLDDKLEAFADFVEPIPGVPTPGSENIENVENVDVPGADLNDPQVEQAEPEDTTNGE